MSGNGKSGSRSRRSGRRRERDGAGTFSPGGEKQEQEVQAVKEGGGRRGGRRRRRGGDRGKREGPERLKWTPPVLSTAPLPSPDCPICGKPVRDLAAAIADRGSGAAQHFECVLGRITREENPGKGETVAYLGGGRFGVLSFTVRERRNKGEGRRRGSRDSGKNSGEIRTFSIRKILEWEDKENRAEWRAEVSDHYSVT